MRDNNIEQRNLIFIFRKNTVTFRLDLLLSSYTDFFLKNISSDY